MFSRRIVQLQRRTPSVAADRRRETPSFLPLSHSYEHTAGWIPLSIMAQIYYAESADKLAANMEEVSPTTATAVLRCTKRCMAAGVFSKGRLIEKLFMNAVKPDAKTKERLASHALLDPLKLVRKKVAAVLPVNRKRYRRRAAELRHRHVFQIARCAAAAYGQTESPPISATCQPRTKFIPLARILSTSTSRLPMTAKFSSRATW